MKPADKIKDLQKQLDEEQRKIDQCRHDWGEPYNNPGTKKEPYGVKLVGQGSDLWPEAEGYHDVTYPRWSRKFGKCSVTLLLKSLLLQQRPDKSSFLFISSLERTFHN